MFQVFFFSFWDFHINSEYSDITWIILRTVWCLKLKVQWFFLFVLSLLVICLSIVVKRQYWDYLGQYSANFFGIDKSGAFNEYLRNLATPKKVYATPSLRNTDLGLAFLKPTLPFGYTAAVVRKKKPSGEAYFWSLQKVWGSINRIFYAFSTCLAG